MPRVVGFDLCELDLPFRRAFHHAAARRDVSASVFVRCRLEGGVAGYGETLPRVYVTGEDRTGTFDLLAGAILPRLLGMEFGSFPAVRAFLDRCDGKAPAGWVDPAKRQTAAWSAVDLALLDSFGRAFGTALGAGLPGEVAVPGSMAGAWPEGLRYSLVLSCESGPRTLMTLFKARLYGLGDAKVKVKGRSVDGVRWARRILGRGARLRVDSNMSWTYEEAREAIPALARLGVGTFEQPLAAGELDQLARLTAELGVSVVADESVHDAASLERVIAARAATGVSVRIAKCGGLIAALARCRRVLEAGLTLQIGCQVGETSQLSAAQLALVRTLGGGVKAVEGCFGERLLLTDPVRPLLQFGRHGRPPAALRGAGFGTEVDWAAIERHAGRRISLDDGLGSRSHSPPVLEAR